MTTDARAVVADDGKRLIEFSSAPALLAGIVGVAASILVLGFLAPLPGGVLSTALITSLLLVVPGYLAVGLLQLQSRFHSLPSLLAASVALGAGIVIPFCAIARSAGWPLDDAARGLVGVEALMLLSWVALARRASAVDGFDGLRARPLTEWVADFVVFAAGFGLAVLFVVSLEPAMRSGDLWYYASYIDWMAHEPGHEYVPHSFDPEERNGRLISSGFLAFEAMITTLVSNPGSTLDVFWSWLPATLIPLTLIATYSVACALGSGALTRIAIVAAQLALVFATFGYFLDRDTSGVRWAGSILFFRISQDKVFLALVLAPMAARFAIEWMERREARWLGALSIAGAGCIITHPLGLPFLAILTLPYAVATAVLVPSKESHAQRWRAVFAIAIAIAPLAIWPLMQSSKEGVPNTLADDAAFHRREHLTRDSLSISDRKQNEYTAHPSLVAHPMMLGGIACALGLGLASRRRADARYAFATMLAPLLMLYTPGITPLAGSIVTPYLLWRFTWLLPVALSVAVAATVVAAIAERAVGKGRGATRPITAVLALAGFGFAASAPSDFAKSRETIDSLLPPPFGAETASRLIKGIREIVPSDEVVLLDPSLQSLAISLAPGMQTVYWRWGSDPALYDRIIGLFETRFIASRHIELLREHKVEWLGVRGLSTVTEEVRRRTDLFSPAGSVETIHLFRVGDLDQADAPDDALTYWRKLAAETPTARTLTTLALTLIGKGLRDEAKPHLARAIELDATHAQAYELKGTVLLLEAEYEGAIQQLGRAVELDPRLRNASNNLAWVLATCPNPAFRDAERALALATLTVENGIDGSSLDTLATAQAATGDFDAAIRSTRRSLDIYESAGASAQHTDPLRARLALYAERRPYVEPEPR